MKDRESSVWSAQRRSQISREPPGAGRGQGQRTTALNSLKMIPRGCIRINPPADTAI
eukprot:CAMPEP_0177731136 /NCGR_PEP_ID=MMETSP0484_2-20121128/22383_1 /TAXON_ID=354590 /ORGANISM="Rhodomonas lens, Strain RHODO" /LENGTH=56 /DNA_ID=CAMNT_0019244215 /DNA_START=641 /DNA_END=811 /DNA_ORIENTATION=-